MTSNHYFPKQFFFFADDFVPVNHTFNFQMSFFKPMQKHFIGLFTNLNLPNSIEITQRILQVLKANGDAHKNPWQAADPRLPARIQTLARKVSCFLKMRKLRREKGKQSYPAGSSASFQKGSMGSQKSRAEDSEREGRNARGSVCARGRARVDACVWNGRDSGSSQ